MLVSVLGRKRTLAILAQDRLIRPIQTPIFSEFYGIRLNDPCKSLKRLVELRGIEPLTSAVRLQRSPI